MINRCTDHDFLPVVTFLCFEAVAEFILDILLLAGAKKS
jgi:hypothetical protein